MSLDTSDVDLEEFSIDDLAEQILATMKVEDLASPDTQSKDPNEGAMRKDVLRTIQSYIEQTGDQHPSLENEAFQDYLGEHLQIG